MVLGRFDRSPESKVGSSYGVLAHGVFGVLRLGSWRIGYSELAYGNLVMTGPNSANANTLP
ncbi:MAG: hypothetical protein ABJO86_01305 [Lentilitoribacter sp.]